MAFIVEDGTGLVDSNSYVTVQEYRDYATDRGKDVTAELDADIQGYLVEATDYMDLSYTFKGEPSTDTQALQFPRVIDTVDVGVPLKIKYATIEMAFSEAKGISLFIDTEKNVTMKKEKVGPIETMYEYDTTATIYQSNAVRFPKADGYVKPYVESVNDNPGNLRAISG